MLDRCVAFLENHKLSLEIGTVEIGDGIRCIVNEYFTVPESDAKWEAHKKFIDVHCVLDGEELIRIGHVTRGGTGNYSPEQDYLEVSTETTAEIILRQGRILCLFPNDAHQVKLQVSAGRESLVKKVVFKIPVELFS